MKKMKFLALALSLCGLFGAQSAMADTVNFTGTYPADACQFTGSPTDGIMGISLQNPLEWGTSIGSGSPASIGLSYIGQPTVTVAAVGGFNAVAGSVPSGTTYLTRAYLNNNGQINSGSWYDTGSKSLQLSNSYSNDTVYVHFVTVFGSAPTAGNYTASTTVTCS